MTRWILDRALIHFFSAGGLVLWMKWLLDRYTALADPLLVAALVIITAAAMREPWDTHKGQPVLKAYTDIASWVAGCASTVWLLG